MSQSMTGAKPRFLGQFIIKHGFQFKYSLYIFALVAGMGLILWLEARMTLSGLISSGMVVGDDAIEQVRIVSALIGKSAFMLSGISFGVALVLTHFIAGPIYRFEKLFQQIKVGNIGVLARLRQHDEFQETAEELNQALAGLRGKLQKERDATTNVAAEFAKVLDEAGRPAEAAQLKKMIAEIHANSENIRTQIQR